MIRRRIIILIVLVGLPFLAVLGRLASLQLDPAAHARYLRLSLHLGESLSPPRRGRILARDGRALAENEPVYAVEFQYARLNPRAILLPRLVRMLGRLAERSGATFPAVDGVEAHLLDMARAHSLADWETLDADAGAAVEPLPLIEGVPAEAVYRSREGPRLRNLGVAAKAVLDVRPDGAGDRFRVLFHPREALRMEIVLYRLARLLAGGGDVHAAYGELCRGIEAQISDIERRVENEVAALERELVGEEGTPRRGAEEDGAGPPEGGGAAQAGTTEPDVEAAEPDGGRSPPARRSPAIELALEGKRQSARDSYYERRWFPLKADVPIEVVTAIEYHPALFPGLQVVEGVRRRYPKGAVVGTIVGRLRGIHKEEMDDLIKARRLLDRPDEGEDDEFPRGTILDRDDFFARIREGRFTSRDLVSSSGLERAYDRKLRGLYGRRVVRVDKWGDPSEVLEDILPEDGADIRTSLDLDLQRALYDALEASLAPKSTDAGAGVSGSVVVLDLATDGILASVGFPSADPEEPQTDAYAKELAARFPGARDFFLDRPSQVSLFPGSVFKLVLAAASVDARPLGDEAYTPERRYECTYEFRRWPSAKCAHSDGHTPDRAVDLVEAIQHSCNVYFYHLGVDHLGPAAVERWARALGYGVAPGVELPSPRVPRTERSLDEGILVSAGSETLPYAERPPAEMITGEGRAKMDHAYIHGMAAYSIGQQYVKATPLQVVRSVAAIALEGRRLPVPRFVPLPSPPPSATPHRSERVFGADVAARIREGMWRAGHAPGGTATDPPDGTRYGLERFSAAYKTGTATCKTKPPKEYHSWLVGFAPHDAPRIAFAIAIERAKESGRVYAGAAACAPVARILLEHFAKGADGDAYLVAGGGR